MQIDTVNRFLVGVAGPGEVTIIRPPLRPINKAEAINLAAWLVVLSRATRDEVEAAIAAVENT